MSEPERVAGPHCNSRTATMFLHTKPALLFPSYNTHWIRKTLTKPWKAWVASISDLSNFNSALTFHSSRNEPSFHREFALRPSSPPIPAGSAANLPNCPPRARQCLCCPGLCHCSPRLDTSLPHGSRSALGVSEMKTTPLPPGSPGTGSSFIPDSVVPSLSFSFPLAAWDLKTRQTFENKDEKKQDKQIFHHNTIVSHYLIQIHCFRPKMKNSQNIRNSWYKVRKPCLQETDLKENWKNSFITLNHKTPHTICVISNPDPTAERKPDWKRTPTIYQISIYYSAISNPAQQDCINQAKDLVAASSRIPPHSPPPLDIEPATIDNEFVEGFLSSHLCSLPGGKLDESTLLSLHYSYRPNLPKLVEVIPVWGKKTVMKSHSSSLQGTQDLIISWNR